MIKIKVRPKAFIIPLYIIYVALVVAFIMWLDRIMPKQAMDDIDLGLTIFIMAFAWSPAYVGLWLHEKLFPKQYQK